jgi:bacterioferritin (cytochrome b1)
MKGNPEIIKVLNEVLRKELTGINQYFIHSKMCKKCARTGATACLPPMPA